MSNLTSQVKSNILKLKEISDIKSLEDNKQIFFGKSGLIVSELKALGSLSPEEKKEKGKEVNLLKAELLSAFESRKAEISAEIIRQKLNKEAIDLSLPTRNEKSGTIHPLTRVKQEVLEIFGSMGFSFRDGPEIENDYYNFEALNIPAHHPARDMHDTFYINHEGEKNVLRTHTSSVQIRAMQDSKPPFKFVSVGRVFRCDYDATHTPMFHQVEGVYIDKNINMGHLKGCLQEFLNKFFNQNELGMRMRPSYFPFTEPSAEVDIARSNDGKWLEILGCGMVHPKVLENVGVDPAEYQGFAFGMGLERITMLKYGMEDLRPFFDGDMRWSKKHGFKYFDFPSIFKEAKK